jgi:hypothetical protein
MLHAVFSCRRWCRGICSHHCRRHAKLVYGALKLLTFDFILQVRLPLHM